MSTDKIVFDFGANWMEFSERAISEERVNEARRDFRKLTQGIDFKSSSFLDIGFGQGLSLMIATESGARTVGCDINPKCREALDRNHKFFPKVQTDKIEIVMGSILNQVNVKEIKNKGEKGKFDIVHSWGVLHHTGKMYPSIDIAASLVKPGGHLIIAIYNRHWTSPIWALIKWVYNHAPRFVQKHLIWITYKLKSMVGYDDRSKRHRGMDFYYDVIDWVGGYPYEYASKNEIEYYLCEKGFKSTYFNPTGGFTGCNEFVFKNIIDH